MTLRYIRFVLFLAALAMGSAVTAADYPTRPVRIVNG